MAGDEDQLVRPGAFGAPLQEVIGLERFAVLVDAEESHIQVVARIGEVIRVAAVEGGLLLRRKDQAHVGVSLVLVEPVLTAVVKRDHIGAQTGLVFALLGDGRNLSIASLQRLGVVGYAFGRALHPRRNILHGHQHVDFEVGGLHLLLRRRCIEAVAEVVVLGGRVFLQLAARHVMIGEQQAVGADKRARSAVVEPDAGEPQMIEPGLRGMEVILGRQQLEWRVVKGPHAFFGVNHGRRGQQKSGREQQNGTEIASKH